MFQFQEPGYKTSYINTQFFELLVVEQIGFLDQITMYVLGTDLFFCLYSTTGIWNICPGYCLQGGTKGLDDTCDKTEELLIILNTLSNTDVHLIGVNQTPVNLSTIHCTSCLINIVVI